jgi:RNA polymerase sigma-70 factor (ECF subfamily)
MGATEDFQAVMAKLRRGDPDAATEIFRRYVRRLTALASRQFDTRLRVRADPEGVVQSVYRSFFARDTRAPFELDGWERLWALLAIITIRKCARKRERWRDPPTTDADWAAAVDRQPTPREAVELTELVARIFREIDRDDREATEMILQGYTAVEIAEKVGCSERTVRRLRDRIRAIVERIEGDEERD